MKRRLFLTVCALMLLSSSEPPMATTQAAASACRAVTFETSRFTICTARPDRHRLRMVDAGPNGQPIRNFSGLGPRLGADITRVAFAMNAGMYNLLGYPIGLYVEDGREMMPLNRRDGAGNFHLKPNGVFYGDKAGWHVAETGDFAKAQPNALSFASQSGPMLVTKGRIHPDFAANGQSLHIRNGVGIDRTGAALFVISEDKVSFGRFARLFRDGLGCRNALYFDGFVSRLWDPATGRQDRGVPLGPMVIAVKR